MTVSTYLPLELYIFAVSTERYVPDETLQDFLILEPEPDHVCTVLHALPDFFCKINVSLDEYPLFSVAVPVHAAFLDEMLSRQLLPDTPT